MWRTRAWRFPALLGHLAYALTVCLFLLPALMLVAFVVAYLRQWWTLQPFEEPDL